MVRTTKAQRQAVKQIYDRDPTIKVNGQPMPATYRQIRKRAVPTFGCDGAITLPWAGMWLCIERDGYTHS